jgi:hypothetical protein
MIAVAAWQVLSLSVLSIPAFQASGVWLDVVNWRALALFAVTFALYRTLKWHPVVFIAFGAVCGIFLF